MQPPATLLRTALVAAAIALAAATATAGGERLTLEQGTYAVFHTTDGDFVAKLQSAGAPRTVENFVGLATGRKPWVHPVTLAQQARPLYDNTTIHEIAADVLIRGGDPTGRGGGNPGFTLPLEISPALDFATSGVLAMENSGPVASGCRWFITLTPMPDFTGRHTVFGRVVGGLDVVRDISRKPTRRARMPLEPTLLTSVEILEIDAATRAEAMFEEEDGRRVLTVTRTAIPPPPPPADAATTETLDADTETTAAEEDGSTTATRE